MEEFTHDGAKVAFTCWKKYLNNRVYLEAFRCGDYKVLSGFGNTAKKNLHSLSQCNYCSSGLNLRKALNIIGVIDCFSISKSLTHSANSSHTGCIINIDVCKGRDSPNLQSKVMLNLLIGRV